MAQEEPRINRFMETVGDEAMRKQTKEYQIALFKKEGKILPLVRAQVDRNKWTCARGLPGAYEYGVLEYPYAFWQYGTNSADIPAPDGAKIVYIPATDCGPDRFSRRRDDSASGQKG